LVRPLHQEAPCSLGPQPVPLMATAR
jgi:hypothetical protein